MAGGIRVDPGPMDDLPVQRQWPTPAAGPYGIEVLGTEPAPPEPERTRQYLRQLLNQGMDAMGVPGGGMPTPEPQGRVDVDWPGVKVRKSPTPTPQMPATPQGQKDKIQYQLSRGPTGGMDPARLVMLAKYLGGDPAILLGLGPDLIAQMSLELDNLVAGGYSPRAISEVLRRMATPEPPQQMANGNKGLIFPT